MTLQGRRTRDDKEERKGDKGTELLRGHGVSQGLAHLAAIVVHDKAVRDQVLEGTLTSDGGCAETEDENKEDGGECTRPPTEWRERGGDRQPTNHSRGARTGTSPDVGRSPPGRPATNHHIMRAPQHTSTHQTAEIVQWNREKTRWKNKAADICGEETNPCPALLLV